MSGYQEVPPDIVLFCLIHFLTFMWLETRSEEFLNFDHISCLGGGVFKGMSRLAEMSAAYTANTNSYTSTDDSAAFTSYTSADSLKVLVYLRHEWIHISFVTLFHKDRQVAVTLRDAQQCTNGGKEEEER